LALAVIRTLLETRRPSAGGLAGRVQGTLGEMRRIAVIGAGYVGLVTAACLSELGNDVVCADSDAAKIDRLASGVLPFYEPSLGEIVTRNASAGRLSFTTETADAVRAGSIIFIAVGTPMGAGGQADLSYVCEAAREVGAALHGPQIVVSKSTVPVESGSRIASIVRESSSSGAPVRFVSNPEFLREGSAVADFLRPDRIVIGTSDSEAVAVMRELYAPLNAPFVVTDIRTAEMIKYAANAFLAVKIGFANEVANICERVGAEAPEVMTGIGLDARIGARFLNPGLGWGGSCFGKDVQSLLHTAREYGYQSRLLEAALEVNRAQRQLAIQKLQEKLYILKGRTIALLGLAFKPETDDLRDAPSLQIAERLLQMGARVKVYDPIAMQACREIHPALRVQYCESAEAAVQDADALVLVTEWKQFARLDLRGLAQRMARAILVDGRNQFDPETARRAGFDYCGIGRPQRAARHNDAREPVHSA
jgi:UDPglucose 6-dehydrogenase